MPRRKTAKSSNVLPALLVLLVLSLGLLVAVVLTQRSQDTRNQAWGGFRQGGGETGRYNPVSFLSGTPPVARQGRFAGVDPRDFVVGECDPASFQSTCTNGVFSYCTRQGLQLSVNCADYDAACGVVPVGRYQGQQACIPNDLPQGIDGNLGQYNDLIVGECDPATTTSSCAGDVMTACTARGRLVEVNCAEFGTTCGTLTNGSQACLPVSR